MIHSMTGYASLERNTDQGVIQIELRSVNQRFLELQLKLDERCRMLETPIRDLLKSRLGRGKVECRMNFVPTSASQSAIAVNHEKLEQWAEALDAAKAYFPEAQPVNLVDTLKLPDVLQDPGLSVEIQEDIVLVALNTCLSALIDARASEGDKLKAVIIERLAEVKEQVAIVKPLMPSLLAAYQAKLSEKLKEAVNIDDERVRQEVVLYAQKIDVDEELSRLTAHIEEVQAVLDAGGLVGKRLDFLMQEMNREANTLGSKSVAIETTKVSMQLKVLIEQMREQIQNIE